MNLNGSIDFSNINIKQIGLSILAYRKLFFMVVILALLGYTGYQISQITAVEPDQKHIAKMRKEKGATVPNLRVSNDVQAQLRQLQSAGDTSIPVNVGKSNPFSVD